MLEWSLKTLFHVAFAFDLGLLFAFFFPHVRVKHERSNFLASTVDKQKANVDVWYYTNELILG